MFFRWWRRCQATAWLPPCWEPQPQVQSASHCCFSEMKCVCNTLTSVPSFTLKFALLFNNTIWHSRHSCSTLGTTEPVDLDTFAYICFAILLLRREKVLVYLQPSHGEVLGCERCAEHGFGRGAGQGWEGFQFSQFPSFPEKFLIYCFTVSKAYSILLRFS